MKLWDRFLTAFTLLAIATFCVAIADMFIGFDAIPCITSPEFGLPVLLIAWIAAPFVSRRFPQRGER